MQYRIGKKAAMWLVAAALGGGLGSSQLAFAQGQVPSLVFGDVMQCTNGHRVPVQGALVTVSGTSQMARTDNNGEFTLVGLAPGIYTISAQGAGLTGSRPSVSVSQSSIDIGDIILGPGGVFGCGDDAEPPAQPAATPVPPTATPAPAATSTPVPVEAPAVPPTEPGTGPEPSQVDVPPANTDTGPPPDDTSPVEGVTGLPGPDAAPEP